MTASCLPWLGACSSDQSALDPAGLAARQIAQLFWAMTSAGSVIFAIVIAMLALALWRTRADDAPRHAARLARLLP